MTDKADAETVDEWVRYADDDLRVARLLLPLGLTNAVAYPCQQAAEKWTKALLLRLGVLPPKIHEIEKLPDLIATRGPAANQEVYAAAARLTPDATKPRYPGLGEVTVDDVVEALALAAVIRDAVAVALAREAP